MNINEILKRIRNTRINEKKTLKNMSEQLGNKSVSSYCKKELGDTPITLYEYLKICEILGKPPIYFLK